MPRVTRINVDLPDALKARLEEETEIQRRSQRAIVVIALEEYFARLDADRADAAESDAA